MTHYQSLEAWKKSMLIVKSIYQLCKSYPKEELFSLTSQTKRAAVSVPANIAEGCGRRTTKDTVSFLHISRGSLYELETLLNIALMVEMIGEDQFDNLVPQIDECLRILNGLINSYEQKALK